MDEAIPGCLFGGFFFLIVFGLVAFVRFLRHKEILTLAERGLAYPERRNGKDTLRWGIVFAAVGLALIIGLFPTALRGEWLLLLIGLLPTFFGLGLVLIYVLTREDEPEQDVNSQSDSIDIVDE